MSQNKPHGQPSSQPNRKQQHPQAMDHMRGHFSLPVPEPNDAALPPKQAAFQTLAVNDQSGDPGPGAVNQASDEAVDTARAWVNDHEL